MNKKYSFLLAILAILVIFNIFALSYFLKPGPRDTLVVARVIDGDTFETSDGRTIRLANVNAPEKGEPGSEKAAEFLQSYVNHSLKADIIEEDRYNRLLARLYAPDYLNLELVKQGLASKFLVAEEEKEEFDEAERQAVKEEKGIWKKSPYSGCVIAIIDAEKEVLALGNICNDASVEGWWIKDESRVIYTFTNSFMKSINLHSGKGIDNATDLYWGKENIWNNDRDTIYVFDSQDRIALHQSYGY